MCGRSIHIYSKVTISTFTLNGMCSRSIHIHSRVTIQLSLYMLCWQKQQTTSHFITYTQKYSVYQFFKFHIWLTRNCYIKCTLLCNFYYIRNLCICNVHSSQNTSRIMWCLKTNHFTIHHLYSRVLSGTKISFSHLVYTRLLHQVHLNAYFLHHQIGAHKPIWYYNTTFFHHKNVQFA